MVSRFARLKVGLDCLQRCILLANSVSFNSLSFAVLQSIWLRNRLLLFVIVLHSKRARLLDPNVCIDKVQTMFIWRSINVRVGGMPFFSLYMFLVVDFTFIVPLLYLINLVLCFGHPQCRD